MAVNLWVPFTPTFVDANGVPLTGAKLFSYAAGSSTKLSTYTTSSGAVANANPMVLDANGRPTQAIWLTGGLFYKIGLAASTESDPPSAFLWSVDNISGINDATSSASEWIASGSAPTYVSGTSFTVPGDQTSTFAVGRRLQIVDAGGTTWATIKTSAFAAATTITLTDQTAALTAPLSSVAYGIANPAHNSIPKNDNIPVVYNNADPSKIVILSSSGLTTATTRTLTVQDKDLTIAGLGDILNAPVRQTVLNGAVDSSGYANHLSAGAGLNTNISATATPLVITYAQGFGATGATNKVSVVSADASNQGSLAANNTNFITSTYSTDTAVTWGSTLAPPQYGIAYDRTKQSLLRFAGTNGSTTILDDYGNTITANGNAQLSTGTQIDGLNTLALDGTGDYIESTNFTSFGSGSWSVEFKFRWATLPTAGQTQILVNYGQTATNFGILFGLNNTAGTTKTTISLSSNGTSADIAAATLGTSTTWATATNYHFVVTYDALAGKYFVYKDGVQDTSITSASRICGLAKWRFGEAIDATLQQANGNAAGYRQLPHCLYPNGTTFTAPNISTFTISGTTSSDWFDISGYKMYGPTAASSSAGTNPTLTAKNLVYHGEQDTNASAVIATRNYAYQGKYVSADTAITGTSSKTSFSSNLGVPQGLRKAFAFLRNYTGEQSYVPGDVADFPTAVSAGTAARWSPINYTGRNTTNISASADPISLVGQGGGAGGTLTSANWKEFITESRLF